MQITLGADSVAPNPSVLVPPEFDAYSAAILDGRHHAIWRTPAIFEYFKFFNF
jgi:hypothetical protein